jgi:lysozyme family protein
MDFDACLEAVLAHEGDYVDSPADPGGETRFGITAAVARAAGYTGEMSALPLSLARDIYRRQYWDALDADALPAVLRYCMFDAAVNSGVGQAVRWLQHALGVRVDGVLGPVTLSALQAADPLSIKSRLIAQRLRFMTTLPHWQIFSRGWSRRLADLLER